MKIRLPEIFRWQINLSGYYLLLLLAVFSVELLAEARTHQLGTGDYPEQTVMSAKLRGKESVEFLVVNIDADNNRSLVIYTFEKQGFSSEPLADLQLDKSLVVIDKIRLGFNEYPVFLDSRSVYLWDTRQLSINKLLDTSSIYRAPQYRKLTRADLVDDVNGDELDDLVIPDFEGYNLFLQQTGSTPEAPVFQKVHLGVSIVSEFFYDRWPWFQGRQYYKADYNNDGRVDLIFWDGSVFLVYLQTEDKVFEEVPIINKPQITLEFETANRISFGSRDHQSAARFLYNLKDMDGDGVVDLTTLIMNSKGLFEKSSTYEIFKGRRNGSIVLFDKNALSSVMSKGFQFNLAEKDIDQDGRNDLAMSTVELGLGKIIGALITGGVKLDLEFYRMEEGGYPKSPSVNRQVKAEINFSTGKVFYPSVFIRDMDGDGLHDLLVQHKRDQVRLYPGTGDSELFSRKFRQFDLNMDTEPVFLEPVDVNQDNRMDIVVTFKDSDGHRGIRIVVMEDSIH